VEDLSSTHDGPDTEPGELVQLDADPELNRDRDLVLLVTLVELHALDLRLRQDHAEWLPLTPDGEHTEHGAHAPPDVVLELKQEADHVSPVTNVEPLARDQPPNHDRAVWLLSTHKWELSEHGALAQSHVDLELKPEAEHVPQETRVELNVLDL